MNWTTITYNFLLIGVLVSGLLDFDKQKKVLRNQMYVTWMIIFVLFKGLRWDTGTDFPQFLSIFKYSEWDNIFSYWRYGANSELLEPGYVFLNVLVKTFLPHYTFFLLITNAFIIYAFNKLILQFVPQYRLTAFALMMISTEMYPVRQTLATGILCFSFIYIYQKKIKNYIVSIICAYLIHKSSIVLLPLYLINYIKVNNKTYVYFIVSYLIIIGLRTYLQDKLGALTSIPILTTFSGEDQLHYQVTDDSVAAYSPFTIINSVFHLLMFWWLFYMTNRKEKSENTTRIIGLFSIYYFILICLNVMGSIPGIDILYRLANNFWVTYPIIILLVVNELCIEKKLFIGIVILLVSWSIKYNSNLIFKTDGFAYDDCFKHYYSVFETNDQKLIHSANWPFNGK